MSTKLSFITLLLLISFASVNAVLFTPALPDIARFFAIRLDQAQHTISWFLLGYTLGQLVYGPVANRFGRKPALYIGIGLQIGSSLLCVLAGHYHTFWLLVVGRFLLALGSGVGLKMTFTLVNERYEPKAASAKISYLMLAFAITPGLGVALGGILNSYYGWTSCFYAGAVYGVILLYLVSHLPETQKTLQLDAFTLKHLWQGYSNQFKNRSVLIGGMLMGGATCFVYVFAALAPFIAINIGGMNSTNYGLANILPSSGLLLGSIVGAQLAKKYLLKSIIQAGILIASIGVILMIIAIMLHLPMMITLFLPMIVIYFGLCFVLANASTLAMSHTEDKVHGSAVMNFINMGLATLVVLSLGLFSINTLLLPTIYFCLCIVMIILFQIQKYA